MSSTRTQRRQVAGEQLDRGPWRSVLERLTAAVVGAVVAGAVVALREKAMLHGVVAVGAALVLVLAVPTSRLLARRILLAGALLFGTIPALWWWDLPVGDLGRVTVLLAGLAGGLVTGVLWSGTRNAGRRARALVPQWHWVDLVPAAAALATGWVTLTWLRVSSGATALAMLLPGWDNSAHYDMVHMLRVHGVTTDRLAAAANGEHWKYAEYPQGYHTMVATLMETMTSQHVGSVDLELVTYVRAQALLLVIVATMLTAGLAALPRLRRRPLAALPIAAFAATVFVLGPGQPEYTGGFPNFVVAAALAACIPLVVVTLPRVVMPLQLAAIGGLLVGVAHGWVLLLSLAAPAAAVALIPLGARRWRATPRQWLLSVLVSIAVLLGLLRAERILSVLDAAKVLAIPGGIARPDIGAIAVVVLGTIGVCLWGAHQRASARVTWLVLAPLSGLAAAALVAFIQVSHAGDLSYYFWKLLVGIELTSAVVLSIAIVRMLPPRHAGARGFGRLRAAVAALAIAVAVTQLYGATGTGRHLYALPGALTPSAELVLRAATVAQTSRAPRLTVMADASELALHPVNAQQWLLALTARWTVEANDDAGLLIDQTGVPVAHAEVLRELVARYPASCAIISPSELGPLRLQVAQIGADACVMSW